MGYPLPKQGSFTMHCSLRQRTFPSGLTLIACFALAGYAVPAPAELPDAPVLRGWIQDMKERERGPFSRIRWFCNDGTILPPDAYACVPHGGGSQHGEWTEQVKRLRGGGYFVANVLADLDVAEFLQRPDHRDAFNQMLIEQFLINVDDGWILRKARYYRGALQEEGERRGARRLLFKLAEDPRWLRQSWPISTSTPTSTRSARKIYASKRPA